jgi:hypothetical protein
MNITKITFTLTALFFILPAIAQGAPPATPIDGGLSLLLAGGAAYGLKKIKDNRRSNN